MARREEVHRRAEAWMNLDDWKAPPLPERKVLKGAFVRLEPLDVTAHAAPLFEASVAAGAEERFRYLPDPPPACVEDVQRWAKAAAAGSDPLFFAVVDNVTGRAQGRQALMRIDAKNGVIEIGHILWGPAIARTRKATEAFYLFADHVFALGYRRLEWKCNDLNVPSKRAAERFGFTFEGVFRQHMVVKGRNRDTAWFSIIDHEWPALRMGYRRWLDAGNFDAEGRQLNRLTFVQ